MPITNEERIEHMEKFNLTSLDTMPTADYREALEQEAFFGTIRTVSLCIPFLGNVSSQIQNNLMPYLSIWKDTGLCYQIPRCG